MRYNTRKARGLLVAVFALLSLAAIAVTGIVSASPEKSRNQNEQQFWLTKVPSTCVARSTVSLPLSSCTTCDDNCLSEAFDVEEACLNNGGSPQLCRRMMNNQHCYCMSTKCQGCDRPEHCGPIN